MTALVAAFSGLSLDAELELGIRSGKAVIVAQKENAGP
jgi:hypothetical protein